MYLGRPGTVPRYLDLKHEARHRPSGFTPPYPGIQVIAIISGLRLRDDEL